MKLKKAILTLSLVLGIASAPMTVFAAHTHSWGSTEFYGFDDVKPDIFADASKCVTRHVYNYRQCRNCGDVSIFEVDSYEMTHDFRNGMCANNCGRGVLREAK